MHHCDDKLAAAAIPMERALPHCTEIRSMERHQKILPTIIGSRNRVLHSEPQPRNTTNSAMIFAFVSIYSIETKMQIVTLACLPPQNIASSAFGKPQRNNIQWSAQNPITEEKARRKISLNTTKCFEPTTANTTRVWNVVDDRILAPQLASMYSIFFHHILDNEGLLIFHHTLLTQPQTHQNINKS